MSSPLAVVTAGLLVVAVLLRGRTRRGNRSDERSTRPDGGTVRGFSTATSAEEKPGGVRRLFTTVDHKDIGLFYLGFATLAALWGGMDAMMIRTELLTPVADVWAPTPSQAAATYNALFTTHGLTMLFFFVTPGFVGLANYFVPLLIGADDMAFPRINAVAFWLLPPSLILVRAGLITEVLGKVLLAFGRRVSLLLALKPPEISWTMYTPLSQQSANPQVDLLLLGLHLSGLATIMASINIVVTVFVERAEEVTWARLDIFSWAMLTTSGIVVFAFPLLGSALVMLLLDRNFGTTFFALDGGGPILWQHLFWFFGHPEVYILVLPAFGLTSLILPKFSRRRLFGFRFVVYSTLAIGTLSFGVWAHHMFATGMDPRLRASFMAVSLAIAVPSAVKTFNWITTMWNGDLRLTTPMLFCIGSIATFVVGGVTGVFLASIPVDLVLHDTYYVVGHFHLILVGIILFAGFAASYYWYPILTGRMYHERLGQVHALVSIAGVFVTFVPMLVMGLDGLPRRYAAYPAQFTPLNWAATAGAFTIGLGAALWLWNVVQSYRVGPRVEDADVWDLKEIDQFTREWRWFERRLAEQRGTGHEESTPGGADSGDATPGDD
ncbi:MAG: cbb3-type cytochrome c oxidase subunit I [Haloferacaceae archaeon]